MSHPWTGASLECVAFDMDGTLLNSGDFGVRAIRLAFERLMESGELPGLETVPADDDIRAQIGKPPYEFYKALLPEPLKHKDSQLHAQAGANEREFLMQGTGHLFEGARDVLADLHARGLKLLLVSNCSTDYMDAVVEAFGLDELFAFRSPAGRSPDVSKPGELKRGLNEIGVKVGVMVGDRVHDLQAARDNGLWFVGCTYGYGPREELAGADALIHDIRNLPALL